MHLLFEVEQALRSIEDGGADASGHRETVTSLRLGMVLMGLSRSPLASEISIRQTFRYLSTAETAGSLQVFVDRDGVRRGHCVVALIDEAADAAVRNDPKIAVDGLTSTDPAGASAWLVALFGGAGQGAAIIRNLRDNLLRQVHRLSYVRQRGGSLLLKTLETDRRSADRSLCRERPKLAEADFAQLKMRQERYRRFYHYARLLSQTAEYDLSVAAAIERFGHSNALKQCRFDNDDRPNGFVSWAMIGATVADRLHQGQAGLRPGDWLSGSRPCLVDLLGDERSRKGTLDWWCDTFAGAHPVRLRSRSSGRKVWLETLG